MNGVSIVLLAGAFLVGASTQTEREPMNAEKEVKKDFKLRMGFGEQPPRPPSQGIVADWTQLPSVTKPFREGWKLYHSSTDALPTDGGDIRWTYKFKKRDIDRLHIKIEVHQNGQEEALKSMNEEGYATSMVPNPYGPAPESMRLGDFTAMSFPERVSRESPPDFVFWVYYNVFARVEADVEGNHFDVMPIAQAIQSFMEKHVTNDLSKHLPAVTDFVVPTKPVRVGEQFTVKLVPGPSASVTDWFVHFKTLNDDMLIDHTSQDPLVGVFDAKAPGKAVVEADVFDKKTLLSRVLRSTIEILQAPRE